MLLLGNKNFLRRHPDTYTPSTQLLLRIYESLLYVPLNVQNCLTEFFFYYKFTLTFFPFGNSRIFIGQSCIQNFCLGGARESLDFVIYTIH